MTTPLTTAIERIEKMIKPGHLHNDSLNKAIEILRSLLPDEEKFAEDAFIAGEAYERDYPFNAIPFTDFYSQFKPKQDDPTHPIPEDDNQADAGRISHNGL